VHVARKNIQKETKTNKRQCPLMGKQYKIREDSPQGASQKWRDSFMGASVL